jgi:hypothetical protein
VRLIGQDRLRGHEEGAELLQHVQPVEEVHSSAIRPLLKPAIAPASTATLVPVAAIRMSSPLWVPWKTKSGTRWSSSATMLVISWRQSPESFLVRLEELSVGRGVHGGATGSVEDMVWRPGLLDCIQVALVDLPIQLANSGLVLFRQVVTSESSIGAPR